METLRGTAVVAGELELVSIYIYDVKWLSVCRQTNSHSKWMLCAKTEKYELLLSKGIVVDVLSDVDVGLK